jgi:hypothetical protein
MPPQQRATLLGYAAPFMIFMLGGWWGLAQLIDNKRKLRVRGLWLALQLFLPPAGDDSASSPLSKSTRAGVKVMLQTVWVVAQLQGATRGLDSVEELDPLEAMHRRYGMEQGQAGSQIEVSGGIAAEQ